MNYAQEQRLRMIDILAEYQGEVWREPIMAFFGVSAPQVTRDFREYNKLRPNNLAYNPSTKRYHQTPLFEPLFNNLLDKDDK